MQIYFHEIPVDVIEKLVKKFVSIAKVSFESFEQITGDLFFFLDCSDWRGACAKSRWGPYNRASFDIALRERSGWLSNPYGTHSHNANYK